MSMILTPLKAGIPATHAPSAAPYEYRALRRTSESGPLISSRRPPASAAEEGVSVTGQLFLVIEELSPSLVRGGEIREGIPECLHGEPAVVPDVLERIAR